MKTRIYATPAVKGLALVLREPYIYIRFQANFILNKIPLKFAAYLVEAQLVK